MIYTCCDDNRRAAVDAHPTLNGIDWLEVLDLESPHEAFRQQTLLVRLLKPVPAGLIENNVEITGGERIREVTVDWAAAASLPPPAATADELTYLATLTEPDHLFVVRTNSSGDFSTYRLHLVQGSGSDAPITDFDPRLSTIDFTFKVECPSDFDCAPANPCTDEPKPSPDINYLARDYASIRRLVIDRLSQLMPGWRDRSPADLATTLSELIAYVGDLQHYHLDAVATEAYLHTARRRSSLRRHALLVDYPMHEGCNSRTWLHLEVNSSPVQLDKGQQFLTHIPGIPARITPDSADERLALQTGPLFFESMHEATLRAEHNDFLFYTWGDERCCLPEDATQATLAGHWPELQPGAVLIFQEQIGPLTGEAGDADPGHRHAVRLIGVDTWRTAEGGTSAPLIDPLPNPDGTFPQITEISWHAADALPFPLCLSSELDEAHHGGLISSVSIALGNNVLVDHGRRITADEFTTVPAPLMQYPVAAQNGCHREAPEPLPPRINAVLPEGPVTHQGKVQKITLENGITKSKGLAFDPDASASSAFTWLTADATPETWLSGLLNGIEEPWEARRDLLSSRASDAHFVVEIEDDGTARLRFGDDRNGRRPNQGTVFSAEYRVGNGPQGNVGADTITHLITTDGRIDSLTNPLPARGGAASETPAQVRRRAPQAFRTQERAVTPDDYAEVTERLDGVQRAAAGLRWTGSWHTMFVTVDRDNGEPVRDGFAATVVEHLDQYRMAGHDLHVNDPQHVSLEIDMLVCVNEAYFRSHVRHGLLEAFSSGMRANGTRGLFHADNLSFGQTVFLSPLYAAARTVAGVSSVQITRFHRQGQADPKPLADGYIKLGRLEIARLDNDPNFPEHGVLRVELHGGK